MSRAPIVVVVLSLALAMRAAIGCKDDPIACKVDTDCPQGDLCRDQKCGPVGSDGGTASDAAGGATEDTTPDPGTSSGTPTCRGLYEGCSGSGECCGSYDCKAGVCR
jgi:hypothetical protein